MHNIRIYTENLMCALWIIQRFSIWKWIWYVNIWSWKYLVLIKCKYNYTASNWSWRRTSSQSASQPASQLVSQTSSLGTLHCQMMWDRCAPKPNTNMWIEVKSLAKLPPQIELNEKWKFSKHKTSNEFDESESHLRCYFCITFSAQRTQHFFFFFDLWPIFEWRHRRLSVNTQLYVIKSLWLKIELNVWVLI